LKIRELWLLGKSILTKRFIFMKTLTSVVIGEHFSHWTSKVSVRRLKFYEQVDFFD